MQKILNFINFLVLKVFKLLPRRQHYLGKEMFIAGHLVSTLLISFLYLPFLWYIEYFTAFWVVVGYIFTHLFLLFPLFKAGLWIALTHSFSAMAAIGFTIIACTSGGIMSPIVAWFLSIKVVAYWFYGKWLGVFWSIVSITIMVVIYGLEKNGFDFSHNFPKEYHALYSGFIHIGVLFYYFLVLHVYEYWQHKSIDSIQKSANERDQLFRMVVHDVKNPLNVILARSKLLQKKLAKYTEEEIKSKVSSLEKSAIKIDEIISKILDKNGFKSLTRQEWQQLDLTKVLDESINTIREHASEKNIAIEVDAPNSLIYRSHWLGVFQIFINLLSNAVKYSKSDTLVHVKLSLNQDNAPVFIVKDQGIGLEREQIAAFYQGENVGNKPTAGESTSGEGSQILAHFADSLDATIKVESEGKDKGSVFTITFPKVA